MSTTYIRAFRKSDDADTEVGMRITQGFKILRIDKTDRIQLDGDAPSSTIWSSGPDEDWIVIVATKDATNPALG